jgi:hypothetical protein
VRFDARDGAGMEGGDRQVVGATGQFTGGWENVELGPEEAPD